MARRFGKSGFGGKAARAGAESRASLYDEVTATIVAQLEAVVFPWVKPWNASAAGVGLPRNAVTGRSHAGINVLIL